MDYKAFFKHLNKYKWLIIIVPLIAVGITYFMVKNLPNKYSSQVLLSTGLVDQSKQVANEPNMDYLRTAQAFANIIEKIKMKKVMSQLSYTLIIHDLENPKTAFKKYSTRIDSLSPDKKIQAIADFKEELAKREILSLADNRSKDLFILIASMGYDEASISKNLTIAHNDNSDFVNVTYVSENPLLSAYMVNTLASLFIDNYTHDVQYNQYNSASLLDSLLEKKRLVMMEKNGKLRDFKMSNGVLNLGKQSENSFTLISANEERKSTALRQIQSDQSALALIEAKLAGKDNIGGANLADNRAYIDIKNKIKIANDRLIDGNYKAVDQKKVDSLRAIERTLSFRSSDNNVVDPLASKQALVAQRQTLQIDIAQVRGSLTDIDKELSDLKSQYNKMGPLDANIQNLERDADLATKDYTDALNQYNATMNEQSIRSKVNIAQIGLIGTPEPSKQLIYLIISGFASFFICFMGVVALFFLDKTISTPVQLTSATDMPIVGKLNYIDIGGRSIKSIWNDTENDSHTVFKNLLRSLRLEITNQMDADGSRILGITSLVSGEGKSFIASSLAHAFAMTGKKILLIGGETSPIENPKTPEPAANTNFETFLIKREIHTDDLITVLNWNDPNTSLLEIQNSKNLKNGFEVLRNEFDMIIIDINSLNDINIAKEWLMFTEKNLAVFEAGKALSDADKELIDYLKSQPGFIGWVMNKIKLDYK